MLPNHHEAARHLAERRRVDAERAARDHAAAQERRDGIARMTPETAHTPRAGTTPATQPCPPPCPKPARA